MLLLMNNARISVGFESIGLCEAAYRMAKAYAAERPSMGKTIDQHEMIAEMLDEMESDILGLRALAVKAAHNEELARRAAIACKALPESDPGGRGPRAEAPHLGEPQGDALLKYVTSEKAVEMARRNIQIHGGAATCASMEPRSSCATAWCSHLRRHQPDPVPDGDEGQPAPVVQEAHRIPGSYARYSGGSDLRLGARPTYRQGPQQRPARHAQPDPAHRLGEALEQREPVELGPQERFRPGYAPR